MSSLEIRTYTVTDFQQNARLIIDHGAHDIVAVDIGGGVDRIISDIDWTQYKVSTIFLTHCHIDHGGGVVDFLERLKEHQSVMPKVMYHENDAIIGQHIDKYAQSMGFPSGVYKNTPSADIAPIHQGSLMVGSFEGRLLFTPGHAPGHFALFFHNVEVTLSGDFSSSHSYSHCLIAGDALFRGSIGRTDLPLGDHDTLIQSIKTELLTLPDDTLVLAGHGPNTSIAHERTTNPFLV